jgi:hypothetical protein
MLQTTISNETNCETEPPVKEVSSEHPIFISDRKKQMSEEARQRISESQKLRWATRRLSSSNTHETPPSQGDPQHISDSTLTLVLREGYKGDPFYINKDGYFVGEDGFVVPKDFNEFFTRYPRYIENWVRRRLNGQGIPEDIEDWCQELIIHMKYLPSTSKYRSMGKEDVIQTFDPFSQYGASERRWRSYLNYCLANKYNTIHGKRIKNPICRMGNISIVAEVRPDIHGEVTDEYVYSKSETLCHATNLEETKQENLFFTHNFFTYVEATAPEVLPVLEAVYLTGSSGDTIREFCKSCNQLATTKELDEGKHDGHDIGMSHKEFNRARNRLKKLATLFLNKKPSNCESTQAELI